MIVTIATVVFPTPLAPRISGLWKKDDDRAVQPLGRSRKQQSLLARAVLQVLLAETTGRTDWVLAINSKGKPWLVDGPSISLSHTRGLVAAAVADEGDLGIDVERHRPRNIAALSGYAFGGAEQAEVAAGGTDAFYRIWSLREAMAKATGAGLTQVSDGCDQVAGGPVEGSWALGSWHLAYARPAADCSLAIAHRTDSADSWKLDWRDLSSDELLVNAPS